MRAHRLASIVLLPALFIGLIVGPAAASSTASSTLVMQRDRLDAQQLADWFTATKPRSVEYRAGAPVQELALIFIEEGRYEGIAGDIAFAQSVLETAWFSYPSFGQVKATDNNFAGIGACDGGTCTVARFPSPRIGVRAQIHHLRAYADPDVTAASLANPLESPRFHLVSPKGMAPRWEDFGNGRWATDPHYATKVLNLYASMLRHADSNGGGRSGSFTDVNSRHTHFRGIESIAAAGVTKGCTTFAYCPDGTTTRGQMAVFIARATGLEPSENNRFTDVSGSQAPSINALADAGITLGCGGGRFCPNQPVTRGEMATFIRRAEKLPVGPHSFTDVNPRSTHYDSVGALVRAGITTGHNDGTFRPDGPVSRAQMASFLDRAGLGS